MHMHYVQFSLSIYTCLLYRYYQHGPYADGIRVVLTSCMVAYYSMDERPSPPNCTTKELCAAGSTVDRLPKRYLKKWANCVKKEFRSEHGRV